MGDPNGSLPTPQPVYYRPMYGQFGQAMALNRVNFLSQAAIDRNVPAALGLKSPCVAVKRCRTVTKQAMVRNSAMPAIEVDPETFAVRVDGELAQIAPATRLPLSQLYYLA